MFQSPAYYTKDQWDVARKTADKRKQFRKEDELIRVSHPLRVIALAVLLATSLAPALAQTRSLAEGMAAFEADDFKRIKGVGLVLEQALNELGIYHYYQLATLTFNNVRWVEHQIGFPGRVQREDWIAQARDLARGNVTEYSSRFDKGKTPYSG